MWRRTIRWPWSIQHWHEPRNTQNTRTKETTDGQDAHRLKTIYKTFLHSCALVFIRGLLFLFVFGNESHAQPLPNQPVATTALVEKGRHLFLLNCAHCHGDDAKGDEGPNLYEGSKNETRIRKVVTQGIKGEMPAFGSKFNED